MLIPFQHIYNASNKENNKYMVRCVCVWCVFSWLKKGHDVTVLYKLDSFSVQNLLFKLSSNYFNQNATQHSS